VGVAVGVGVAAFITSILANPIVRVYYVNDATHWEQDQSDTIPMAADILYGFTCGLLMLLTELAMRIGVAGEANTNKYIMFRLALMMFNNLVLTASTTEFVKIIVGALRPGFARACMPNTTFPPLFYTPTAVLDNFMCTSPDLSSLKEYRVSFPSGHSSFAFAASVFLALYFIWRSGSLRSKGPRGPPPHLYTHILQALIPFPIWCATLIGISRITDNKHFPVDVLGGACLGSLIASVTFYIVTTNINRDYGTKKHFSLQNGLDPVLEHLKS